MSQKFHFWIGGDYSVQYRTLRGSGTGSLTFSNVPGRLFNVVTVGNFTAFPLLEGPFSKKTIENDWTGVWISGNRQKLCFICYISEQEHSITFDHHHKQSHSRERCRQSTCNLHVNGVRSLGLLCSRHSRHRLAPQECPTQKHILFFV